MYSLIHCSKSSNQIKLHWNRVWNRTTKYNVTTNFSISLSHFTNDAPSSTVLHLGLYSAAANWTIWLAYGSLNTPYLTANMSIPYSIVCCPAIPPRLAGAIWWCGCWLSRCWCSCCKVSSFLSTLLYVVEYIGFVGLLDLEFCFWRGVTMAAALLYIYPPIIIILSNSYINATH